MMGSGRQGTSSSAVVVLAVVYVVTCGRMSSAAAPSEPRTAPIATCGVVMVEPGHRLSIVPLPQQHDHHHPPPLLAWAGYRDTLDTDGWTYLSVTTNSSIDDADQARAAGYIEGYLTHTSIWQFSQNKEGGVTGWSPQLEEFVRANQAWVSEQVANASHHRQAAGTSSDRPPHSGNHASRQRATANNNPSSHDSGPPTVEHPRAPTGRDAEAAAWWHQVGLLLAQEAGLLAGYNEHCPPQRQLSADAMLVLSLHSDMDTLCPLYGCTNVRGSPRVSKRGHCSVLVKLVDPVVGREPSILEQGSGRRPTPTATNATLAARRARGSELVDPELYTAHTTWSSFGDMTRMYKLYDFGYHAGVGGTGGLVPGRRIAMSSYPGNLFSTDDWYTTSAGLAVTETTIDNHNTTLWPTVQPETVMTWIRTMVANRLGVSGPTWAAAFSRANSGTYNNEFHVVDYNRFKASVAARKNGGDRALRPPKSASPPKRPDHQRHEVHRQDEPSAAQEHAVPAQAATFASGARWLQPGVLTIVDQMPGPDNVEVEDRSAWLESRGYWSSYNRPGLPKTYALANYTLTAKYLGPHFSWANTSRGLLFGMLHANATTEDGLRSVMRFNRFNAANDVVPTTITHQACAHGPSASNAIAERGDLTPIDSGCIEDIARQDEGAIDLKYTTAALMNAGELGVVAQSGPTSDDQPPFAWSTSPFATSVNHVGQPDVWDFPYVTVVCPLAEQAGPLVSTPTPLV
jgi:hypothetical protein